ncbi:MAG TPA: hypothetical protein VF290_25425 [Pyrinomonadaceae bacterium]
MSKFRFTLNLFALAVFTLTVASLSQAQTRTWVSGVGDDLNPCSRTAPCKTYAGAISKTADKGEISTLDPGGFGAVTITKNITIDGTSGAGFGSILASGVNGVVINDSATATPGTIVVTLRNLSINGAFTTAGSGIRFTSGKALIVEDCDIAGFTGTGTAGKGISVDLTAGPKNVFIKDTNITNCTVGVRIATTTSFVTAVLDNVNIDAVGNQVAGTSGVELAAGGFAVIRDSVISRFQHGINNSGGANSGARVIGSTLFSNANGINAGASAAHVSDSQFMGNTAGIALTAGGSVLTGCDNFFAGNTNDVTGGALTNQCVK